MVVEAYRCKICEDVLFSRARHDYRTCSCGKVSVNGGIEYFQVKSWGPVPEKVKLDLKVTEEELFADWNSRKDEFGWVKSGKIIRPKTNFSRNISDL